MGRQAPCQTEFEWEAVAGQPSCRRQFPRPEHASSARVRTQPVWRCVGGGHGRHYDPYPGYRTFEGACVRIQRQIHGRPACVARRFLRHAARSCPRQLSQLFPTFGALAVQRHKAGGGRMSSAALSPITPSSVSSGPRTASLPLRCWKACTQRAQTRAEQVLLRPKRGRRCSTKSVNCRSTIPHARKPGCCASARAKSHGSWDRTSSWSSMARFAAEGRVFCCLRWISRARICPSTFRANICG